MKVILKLLIILNVIFYLFQFSSAIGIPEKLSSYQKKAPGKFPCELSAIQSDSQIENYEESIVCKTFEETKPFNSKAHIVLNNWQFNTYLKNNDLQFNFPFIKYKFHPNEYTAGS